MHTIGAFDEPIVYHLTFFPNVLCPGGQTTVTVDVANNGDTAISVQPRLVSSKIFPHPVFADVPHPIQVAAHGRASTSFVATVSVDIPPGAYQVAAYGDYVNSSTITLLSPHG